jgi:hypothetical protein
MSDPVQGEEIVINRPDGTESARWHKLTPAEFIDAAKAVKRLRKRQCAENMGLAGIAGGPLIRALNECDARRVLYPDTLKLVNDMEGQADILMIAIRRKDPNAKYDALNGLGLQPWQWQDYAAKLIDVALKPVSENGDGENPLGEGGGGSGGEKRISSDTTSESKTP